MRNFGGKCKGKNFSIDLRVLTLVGCDIVLGLDYMEAHNPICFILKSSWVIVQLDREIMVLKTIKEDKAFQLLKNKGAHKLFKQRSKNMAGSLFMIVSSTSTQSVAPQLQRVLKEYGDVFEEPGLF